MSVARRYRSTARATLLAAVLALGLAGCGDDDDDAAAQDPSGSETCTWGESDWDACNWGS